MYVDFFCGIGGFSCCVDFFPEISGSSSIRSVSPWAIDINRHALHVYRLNHGGQTKCLTIDSLQAKALDAAPNTFWWMSPPCQPFTKQGNQAGWNDPRSAAFQNMLRLICHHKPKQIGLENVPGFCDTTSHQRLLQILVQLDYQVVQGTLCPTALGYTNRRNRFFLVAWQAVERNEKNARANSNVRSIGSFPDGGAALSPWLEPNLPDQRWTVPLDWLTRFKDAIHVVDQANFLSGNADTRCFTSAYGRSPLRGGSFLRTASGVIRFFTPREILVQLGFPVGYQLPDWKPRRLWPLVGNSLSLPCVRFVLGQLPNGPPVKEPYPG